MSSGKSFLFAIVVWLFSSVACTPLGSIQTSQSSTAGVPANANSGSNSNGTSSPIVSAPARVGFKIKTQENFTNIDSMKWAVQEANSPAAINLSTDVTNVFGEVEANLPNQFALLPDGGVRIISKKQSFGKIGGVPNKTCADASMSSCSFPWTSSQFSGKGGLQSSYGYYEWAVKLPAVPVGGLGTWPATWLLGGQGAPQYEEIDFMERFSADPSQVAFTLHYGNGPGDFNNSNALEFCRAKDPTGNNWADLHSFSVDWEPTFVTGYIDGVACGTVHQGDRPNEYGSTPAIIPSALMFPIFNTAIAPNVNAITAANPVHFDVLHYFYYTNDQQLTAPMPTVLLSGLQTDKANYAPGETVTVFFKLSAGSLALSNVALGGVAVLDFLGDSSGFQEGSSFNDAFGGWNFHAVPGTITANSIYSGSFTYIVPANLPEGVYTIYIGSVEANGKSYPGDYTRLVIGAQSLPPAPSAN